MKKIFNKILFLFLMFFSLFSFVFAEVNPSYTKYEKLSDTEKSKYGLIPDEFISYYDIKPSNIFTYKRSYKASTILPKKPLTSILLKKLPLFNTIISFNSLFVMHFPILP